MFKCQSCNKISKPKESQNTVIVETRPKVYTAIQEVVTELEDGTVETNVVEAVIGNGWEIVKEIKVCTTCAQRMIA